MQPRSSMLRSMFSLDSTFESKQFNITRLKLTPVLAEPSDYCTLNIHTNLHHNLLISRLEAFSVLTTFSLMLSSNVS